jgi:hypothetical protein
MAHVEFLDEGAQEVLYEHYSDRVSEVGDRLETESLPTMPTMPAALTVGDSRYVMMTGDRDFFDLVERCALYRLPRACATLVTCDLVELWRRLQERLIEHYGGRDAAAGSPGQVAIGADPQSR